MDIVAPTVTNEMTTIASKNPDVFITMTGATQCPQIVNETAQNGMKQKTKIMFMSSVCKGASFVGKDKVGGDGSQSTGWWIVGGGTVDYNSPAEDSNAFVKWARELLATKNYDYKLSGGFGLGFTYGFPMVQALIIAGALDGGLTRSNYMLALRTLDMTNPGLIAGVKFNLSGAKDAYLVEGSEIAQYDATKQSWIPQGPIIELSGKSAPCPWSVTTSSCG